MKNWIVNKLVYVYLKGMLDKIPGDGKKTLLSCLLLAVTIAAAAFPEIGSALSGFAQILLSLGAEDWATASVVGLVVGLIHKFLKKSEPEAPSTPKPVIINRQ